MMLTHNNSGGQLDQKQTSLFVSKVRGQGFWKNHGTLAWPFPCRWVFHRHQNFLLSLWISRSPSFSQKELSSIIMLDHWAEIQDIWVPVSVLLLIEAHHFMYLCLSFTWYKIVFFVHEHRTVCSYNSTINTCSISLKWLVFSGIWWLKPYGLYAVGFQ